MSSKCLPGVICIENVTILFILIIIGIMILLLRSGIMTKDNIIINQEQTYIEKYPPVNMSDNIIYNNLTPPLRDNRVFRNDVLIDPRGLPINISTQAVNSSYRQVGLLTRVGGTETILPLMGRPLYVSRDKWNFYTISDTNSMVKLPITFKGNSGTNEYGCDNIYNGDDVYVEGYNDVFKTTMYDNQSLQYIPYL